MFFSRWLWSQAKRTSNAASHIIAESNWTSVNRTTWLPGWSARCGRASDHTWRGQITRT